MRRSASLVSERGVSLEVESSDSATTGSSPSFSSRTVNRLLNRIRNHGSKGSNKKKKLLRNTEYKCGGLIMTKGRKNLVLFDKRTVVEIPLFHILMKNHSS